MLLQILLKSKCIIKEANVLNKATYPAVLQTEYPANPQWLDVPPPREGVHTQTDSFAAIHAFLAKTFSCIHITYNFQLFHIWDLQFFKSLSPLWLPLSPLFFSMVQISSYHNAKPDPKHAIFMFAIISFCNSIVVLKTFLFIFSPSPAFLV